ncbi:oxidoreductase [Cordyceps fumosorosea ARSEF 2679]|uniref:Oxidoreductase n=1 Tax=Cordyceps fumosorosea (strain ARSEF 2679) TaxID=1081104 RepID=A0A162LLJ8_CORFA|nr:oxidoreductase [Cordyceps fumosorosea ARSEF 2679]OAA72404.1 oxidoreductase [Cordyceps fumosorosea ARSEF 2679]
MADQLPEFPTDVETAPLLRLSLLKLVNHQPDEVERFIGACRDLGFFYLHLDGPGDTILQESERLFSLAKDLFDLPLEEKKKYDFSAEKTYFGYKHLGGSVADRTGRLDRNDNELTSDQISRDDILGTSKPWPAPQVVEKERLFLKGFMTSAQDIIHLLLRLLNEFLQLPPNTLSSMHRVGVSSGDQVRLIKAPPQPLDDKQIALGEHTDFGSLTILFNRLGGLQILPPGDGAAWTYVKPLPGHAIINVGDALVKFTNGVLRSNIHRVLSPPGAQGDHARYSVVYFSRPEDDVPLKRLEGSAVIPPLEDGVEEDATTSKDWILRRALGSRPKVVGDDAYDWRKSSGTEDISRRAGITASTT